MRWICIALLWAQTAAADPFAVHQTVQDIFGRAPQVEVVDDLRAVCGAGGNSNPHIFYCTTASTIYLSQDFAARPSAAYEMAHVLGHAIQVQHGVADVALREITRRRDEEEALRGMVTRQVDCVAGVVMARAGLPAFDQTTLGAEPFTDAHWGRRPVNPGPRVSIGLDARAQWYATGYRAADFAACSVGEMSSDLIVEAAGG